MNEAFDPYYTWLGIPPEEQPPDYYRLLGVRQFESQANVLENAAEQRMAHLRSRAVGARVQDSQRLLNEVAQARICLLNVQSKQSYDAELRAKQANSTSVDNLLSETPQDEQPLQAELVPQSHTVGGGFGVGASPPHNVAMPKPASPLSQHARVESAQRNLVFILLGAGVALAALIVVGTIVLVNQLGDSTDGEPAEETGQTFSRTNKQSDRAAAESTNLISLFDPQHVNRGSMSLQGPGLQTDTNLGACQTYFEKFEPPANYRLVAEVTRKLGQGAIVLGIVVDGQPCNLVVDNMIRNDSFQGHRSGLVAIDGLILDDADYRWAHDQRLLTNGRPARIECVVRGPQVIASVDGKEIVRWNGEASRLSRKTFFTPKKKDAFAVGSWQAVYHITRLDIQTLNDE